MEFVEGVKITDVEGIERARRRPADVAKILVVAFSEMLLEHGLFHADPHPGNLLVAPGPKLVMVDFGQVKEVGAPFRFVFGQMTRALLQNDDRAVGQTFRDLGFRMEKDDAQGYEDLGNAYVGKIAKQMTRGECRLGRPRHVRCFLPRGLPHPARQPADQDPRRPALRRPRHGPAQRPQHDPALAHQPPLRDVPPAGQPEAAAANNGDAPRERRLLEA